MKHYCLISILALGAFATAAMADTVTFKQGATNAFSTGAYDGTSDTTINSRSTTVNSNFGAQEVLWVGSLPVSGVGTVRRSLIRYDLSDFAGEYATIDAVTLRVYIEGTGYTASGTTNTLELYKITEDNAAWVAGTGDNAIQTGSACWNYLAYKTTEWDGGAGLGTTGYESTLLASTTWTNTSSGYLDLTFTGTTSELTAIIDAFTSSTTNSGLVLRIGDESNQGVNRLISLGSSESDVAPELIVNYTAIPEPATMAMLGLGGVMMLIRRRR